MVSSVAERESSVKCLMLGHLWSVLQHSKPFFSQNCLLLLFDRKPDGTLASKLNVFSHNRNREQFYFNTLFKLVIQLTTRVIFTVPIMWCISLCTSSVCPCGVGRNLDQAALRTRARQYQQAVRDLISTGKYNTRSDFTVVVQPLFRSITVPRTRVS